MARKRSTPERIIGLLREAEVRLSQGENVGTISRSLGISEQGYYRWRKEYGGLKVSQARRLKDVEKENQRLRRRLGGQYQADLASLRAQGSTKTIRARSSVV
ncbi:transposase [Aurantiacibacter suaedae]|uniref:transposase n=1 Tax=Aurantiacibacter suaedae TaxID=2545755 RepID=UPI0010F51DF0